MISKLQNDVKNLEENNEFVKMICSPNENINKILSTIEEFKSHPDILLYYAIKRKIDVFEKENKETKKRLKI